MGAWRCLRNSLSLSESVQRYNLELSRYLLVMRSFKRLNDKESYELNDSLNEHGGNGENWVFNFNLRCFELTEIIAT